MRSREWAIQTWFNFLIFCSDLLLCRLLFEGLGILLVVVISIGWRCTPAGHEPCHLLFNFDQLFDVSRSQRDGQSSRRCDRTLDQSQWFGGMLSTALFALLPPKDWAYFSHVSLCLSTRLFKKLQAGLDEIFWRGGMWPKDQSFRF